MPEQTLPADFTFSQSSLQDYADCPRRFRLRCVEQLKWPAVESEPALENERRQQEGQLFHRLVQQHRIGLPADKLTPSASTSSLRRWWDNYLAHPINDITGYTQHAEVSLSAPVGACRLLAKYDLVAVRGGRAVIYDWKTSAKRPRDEWMAARMQTRVYRSLLVQAGAHLNGGQPFEPEQVEMVYWYADHPSEPARFPYSSAQYKRDWDGLTALVNEIANHRVFPLTEDEKKCAYCPYRSYCNRGVEAGAGEELETESAGPEINFEQIAEIEF
jgi:CRISPR/Cas system-associated exonuclease Cas4 (RecB family)